MSEEAYKRVSAMKLLLKQTEQCLATPQKVAQRVLREWLGAQGFGAAIEPMAGADLVRRIEAVVVAERVGACDRYIQSIRGGEYATDSIQERRE